MNAFEFGEWELMVGDDFNYSAPIAVLWKFEKPDGRKFAFCWNDGSVKEVPHGETAPKEAILKLSNTILQAMMDGLWKRGLRPKDRRYEMEIELKDQHLQDMRRLVFKEQTP